MKKLRSDCTLVPRVISGLLLAGSLSFVTEGGLLAAGPTPTFAVLAPLFMDNDQQQLNTFQSQLAEAKNIGVQAVSVDVWWGKVQPTSQSTFDWSYYTNVFNMIKNAGLKIVPIMSLHRCGPSNECDVSLFINLPAWVFSLAPDMKFISENGVTHEDAVSVWATQEPNVLAAFKGFISAFASQFKTMALAGDFLEINVSLGTSGELRYPSYDEPGCGFPKHGCFQYYSDRAGADFRNFALTNFGGLSGVNQRWGTNLASASDIRVPQNPDDALTAAGIPSSVPLGMKIPGVHWQMQNTPTPRLAEIPAGVVQTSLDLNAEPVARKDAFGYKGILDMVAQAKNDTHREIVLHFTAAEKGDDDQQQCPTDVDHHTSMAEALVFWISHGAADRGITHKVENANACVGHSNGSCDAHSWEHISNVFEFAPYSGLTFLRLTKNGCDPWDTDKNDYANFINIFKNRQMVTVHLAEWESCLQDHGCFFNVHVFNGGKPADADFGLHFDSPQIKSGQPCRQWWKGPVANVAGGFQFTFNETPDNTTVTWEGNSGQFDRTYNPSQGNDIFALGRQNTTVFTSMPQCP